MYCGTQLGGYLTQDPASTRTIAKITKSSKTLKGPYPCPATVSEEPKSPKPCSFLQNSAIRTDIKTLLDDLSHRNNTTYGPRWLGCQFPEKRRLKLRNGLKHAVFAQIRQEKDRKTAIFRRLPAVGHARFPLAVRRREFALAAAVILLKTIRSSVDRAIGA